MSGCCEKGKCEVCGREDVLLGRTYFHYDFQCECHSPEHFELVRHCERCTPHKPVLLTYIEILRTEREAYKQVAQMLGGCRVCQHYKGYGFCTVDGAGLGCNQWGLADNAKMKASRMPYQRGGTGE